MPRWLAPVRWSQRAEEERSDAFGGTNCVGPRRRPLTTNSLADQPAANAAFAATAAVGLFLHRKSNAATQGPAFAVAYEVPKHAHRGEAKGNVICPARDVTRETEPPIGTNAGNGTADNPLAVNSAIAIGRASLAIGRDLFASANSALAVGRAPSATGDNSSAFGSGPSASGDSSLAAGAGALAPATDRRLSAATLRRSRMVPSP